MANKKKKTISSAKKNKPVKKASAPAPKKKLTKPARQAVAKKATVKKATAKKVTAKKVVKKTKTSAKVKTKAPLKHKTVKSKITKKPATIRPLVSVKKAEKIDYSKAITPLGDRLVVRVANGGERVTAGGLIIPDTVSQATGYLKAQVLAVGSGAKSKKGHLKPLDVKIGDEVLFSEYAGTKIKFGQEEVQIIHESDVMGVVQK